MPIVTPGRRIGSAYDSHRSRQTRLHRARRITYASLMLTSMVDMFTILVLYLVQQFNSTGQMLFLEPNIKLPEAKQAQPAKGSPPVISIDKDVIYLQGKAVDGTATLAQDNQWSAPKLSQGLRDLRAVSASVARATGGNLVTESAQGLVMVQADASVPYRLVKKVLYIASKAGFEQVDFAVSQGATAHSLKEH